MFFKVSFILLVSAWMVLGQRPTFAGSQPIGYPTLTNKTEGLGNRFGPELPLPIEAKGDRDLVERISKLPIDSQPFWYINWKALEDNRKNPQTYEQRPSPFGESPNSQNSNNGGNQDTNTNSGFRQSRQNPRRRHSIL